VDPNKCCLRDVLSTTELGVGSEALEILKQDRKILTPTDLFPVDGSMIMVITPSVFSSTKWNVSIDMQSLPWSDLDHLFVTGISSKTLWAATAFY
jgi:hypothetical protein